MKKMNSQSEEHSVSNRKDICALGTSDSSSPDCSARKPPTLRLTTKKALTSLIETVWRKSGVVVHVAFEMHLFASENTMHALNNCWSK
jgi:hypothetical protein